jgi:hypothetical protein
MTTATILTTTCTELATCFGKHSPIVFHFLISVESPSFSIDDPIHGSILALSR